jgi:hypothetical protein
MIRSGFRIELHEGGNEAELYRISGDRFFSLAEVYWSSDSKMVGVFTCGEPFVRIAYDRSALKILPFSTVESAIRERMRSRYSVPSGEDPFIYPCLNAGTEEHRKRFGDLGIKRGG